MCFWEENQKQKKPFLKTCLFLTFLLFTQCVWSYVYDAHIFYCNLPIGKGEDLLGRAGNPRQNTWVPHLLPPTSSDGEYLDGASRVVPPPLLRDASHFLQNRFLVAKHTRADHFLPASPQPSLKRNFKDLRPLSLPLLRRSSRDVNSPAPVDCQLSQWSEWTDCFPCQEKKVRLSRNVFIYLQMCLWWGCTHINYIYYTYSSFWSIQ